ncbi:MAG TPA: ABC transporter ATP-binding protein [Candidatus Onthovicinus excrementipullorum]|nr:ABC transporter ATP-binding protein [Candidatus Onthovicinus excrementipullorum]
MNLLEVKSITKKYKAFSLGPIDLALPQGTILGLIGRNGSGKTTTIKAILNMINLDGGSISVFGMDHRKHEQEIKQRIGFVPDECSLPPTLNAGQVEKFLSPLFPQWDSAWFEELAERFAIPMNQKIKEFSKGMKMKLMLACALAHRPDLLILDEATSGLDPVVRNEILDLLREYLMESERGIILSSHITSDLEKTADYIAFIDGGKIRLSMCMDDIQNDYGIVKCSRSDLEKLDSSIVIARSTGTFGTSALVSNRRAARQLLPNAVTERATLDDIMLYLTKEESK